MEFIFELGNDLNSPAYTLCPSGNLMLSWDSVEVSVDVEFMKGDKVVCVIVKGVDFLNSGNEILDVDNLWNVIKDYVYPIGRDTDEDCN